MLTCHPLPLDRLLPLLATADLWVLLDSSLPDRDNFLSYLFVEPEQVIVAREPGDVGDVLDEVQRAVSGGLWAAGAVAYEAGYGMEPGLNRLAPADIRSPLVWFGLYRQPLVYDHRSGIWSGHAPPGGCKNWRPGAWEISAPVLDAGRERFSADVERIRHSIAEGRTYQVNYTRRWNFTLDGDPLAFYRELRRAQPVPFGAVIRDEDWRVLSLSPELFFRTDQSGKITTRPMKGTAGRGMDLRDDHRRAEHLRADSKNRAENLMIVDLLRNDLGRICDTGSVRVPELFRIERYRSLLQMTSTVEGQLEKAMGLAGIFRNIFPSGSVTGAPKISTMEIIAGLEDTPRGVYTGAVGFASPGGESCFSVAIRTVELHGGRGVMGSGCGIVADSIGGEEYAECLLKARFLTELDKTGDDFMLIETMLCVDGRIDLLELHLDRLRDSSRYFGRPFDRRKIRIAVERKISGRGGRWKARLLLDSSGVPGLTMSRVDPVREPVRVAFWPEPIDSTGVFHRHKTTCRELYDRARKAAHRKGLFDYIFVNEKGRVTEGSISNVYVERDGVLYTPPLRAGVLPGVYRRHLKASGDPPVHDRLLTRQDVAIADRLWVSNAVAGLVRAVLED